MDSLRLLFTSFLSIFVGIMTFIFPYEATTLLFIGVLCVILLKIVSNMFFWLNLKNSKKFFSNLFLGIFIILISLKLDWKIIIMFLLEQIWNMLSFYLKKVKYIW